VKADLDSHRPRPKTQTFDTPSGFEDVLETEPNFPKSLFLLRPLFTAHELNPVAMSAQASVPVPEGLDLNVWIVPPPPSEETVDGGDAQLQERRVKKMKKGKEKESGSNGVKTTDAKKKKKKRDDADFGEQLEPPPEQTPDEAEEVERVYNLNHIIPPPADISSLAERRTPGPTKRRSVLHRKPTFPLP
jgi:AP-3 complex subunit delta-1